MTGETPTAAWWQRLARREQAWRRVVIVLAVVIVMAQWIRAARKPEGGDFFLHWEFGRRFVAGEFLYAGGMHVPYPACWAMACAPLTIVPLPVAKTLCYPLSIAALAAMLLVLDRLTRRLLPLAGQSLFWTAALALLLASRFIIRELPECGPNLALLALSWLAIYCWSQRREVLGGTCLGLAMALKCTPGLLLAYFAWKRQWRMTALAATAAAGFTLAPMAWQGPALYLQTMQVWLANIRLSASSLDPAVGILGEEPLQNMSLRPAVARYLMRLPANHLARLDHPGYLEFLDLPRPTAGLIAKGVLLALLAAVAWKLRRPVRERADPGVVWECAAVSVLMLLLSPITWGQHCVALLPACYLIARTAVDRGGLARWMNWIVAYYVLVNLVLNRGVLGRDLVLLLDSYYLPTWSFVGLLAVTLRCGAAAAVPRQACMVPPGAARRAA